MPKYKVGDKVVFNREKAQRDIDRLAPGGDRWLDSVPKGPLTIKVFVGLFTVQVEECYFAFLTDWLDKYEEPVRVERFKVGDKVWFLPDEVNKVDPHNIWVSSMDKNRLYTITKREGNKIWLDEPIGFVFSPFWLKKAEEYKGEVKKEAKLEVKISEGRIKDVKFSGPATIVFWTDGTKTVVKCRRGDKFDPEKGIAMACAKKLLGNEDGYHKEIAKYAEKNEAEALRKEAYKLCGKTKCESCPTKELFGECPNFILLGTSELRKLVSMMREAPKYGDS